MRRSDANTLERAALRLANVDEETLLLDYGAMASGARSASVIADSQNRVGSAEGGRLETRSLRARNSGQTTARGGTREVACARESPQRPEPPDRVGVRSP